MTVSSARAEDQVATADTTVVATTSQKAPGAFRTISEVADELNVPQHVLRFWETRFFQVRPLKRGGGRRYYRPEDVALLKKIHHLLYGEGYTIRGVQKLLKGVSKAQLLKEQGMGPGAVIDTDEMVANVANQDAPQMDVAADVVETVAAKAGLTDAQRAALQSALTELKDLQAEMKKAA